MALEFDLDLWEKVVGCVVRIRLEVELETGRQWSGRFTPGRNNDRRKRMQQH